MSLFYYCYYLFIYLFIYLLLFYISDANKGKALIGPNPRVYSNRTTKPIFFSQFSRKNHSLSSSSSRSRSPSATTLFISLRFPVLLFNLSLFFSRGDGVGRRGLLRGRHLSVVSLCFGSSDGGDCSHRCKLSFLVFGHGELFLSLCSLIAFVLLWILLVSSPHFSCSCLNLVALCISFC